MNNSALIVMIFFIDMALLKLAMDRNGVSYKWFFVWVIFNLIGLIVMNWSH